MRHEPVDLRKEGGSNNDPPLTWKASLAIAIILCVSGIAFAVVGYGSGSDPVEIPPVSDHRPYLLLSSTIDSVRGADNVSYSNLQISMVLYLILSGKVDLEENITSEIQSRASFLYAGATGIVLNASSEGLGGMTVLGLGSSGESLSRIAIVPVALGYLEVSITIWGLDE